MFAEEGEDSFRKKEQKALEEVANFDDVIVATGGGAPCFFDNMDLMNKVGHCVFLDVPVDVLIQRLIHAKVERPLIKGKTPEELFQQERKNLQSKIGELTIDLDFLREKSKQLGL